MFVHVTAKRNKNSKPLSSASKSSTTSKTTHPLNNIFSLHRTLGNQAIQRLIESGALQTKLTVGKLNDVYEQEADQIAKQVMRMPDLSRAQRKGVSEYDKVPCIQRMCTECEEELHRQKQNWELGHSSEEKLHGQTKGIRIQRMCTECEEERHRQPMEEEEEVVQAKEVSSTTPEVSSETESQINSIRGGGQPLPESDRAFFEPRFGQDFSQVRIHTDSDSGESAKAVNALAYTVGQDVVFGAGQYAPEMTKGKRLLAHELTHVVQQRSGMVEASPQDIIIQRQFGEPPFGPPLPDFPEPDIDCSVNLAANKLQEFINCCAKTPLGRGCSKDVIEGICKLPGVDCGGKKGKDGEVLCPPGFKPGATRDFKGQCCKEGIVAENVNVCCPTGRIAINAISPRCCPEGTTPDAEKKTCITPPSPIPLCPSGQVTLKGECCFPPFISNGFSCVIPPSPPPKPPVPPPTPLPSSVEIFFQRDRPAQGASGSKALSTNLTSTGKSNFADVVKQLRQNSLLKVQLVGRASPEGRDEYNLDLGRRRAEIIAQALEQEGIDPTRIANPPSNELRSECQEVRPGIFTCGEAGATGPNDRQVLARLFLPN